MKTVKFHPLNPFIPPKDAIFQFYIPENIKNDTLLYYNFDKNIKDSALKMFAVKREKVSRQFDGALDLIPRKLFWNHQSCFFSFHSCRVKMENYKLGTSFLKFTFICFLSPGMKILVRNKDNFIRYYL